MISIRVDEVVPRPQSLSKSFILKHAAVLKQLTVFRITKQKAENSRVS